MKTHVELLDAYMLEKSKSPLIDYCFYIYNGSEVIKLFLFSSTFPFKSAKWGTLYSTLIDMEKYGFDSFPFAVKNRDIIVGRLEEYL